MNKKINHAFGKDIYLLGRTEQGEYVWLEQPTWDCDWYWGFGYVETYTNNRSPQNSKDISSHQHVDSSLMGENNEKGGGYCHNIYDSKMLHETTFTNGEGWELSELFKTFYLLREYAGLKHSGCAGLSSCETVKSLKDLDIHKLINEVDIPKVTARIIEILTPKKL